MRKLLTDKILLFVSYFIKKKLNFIMLEPIASYKIFSKWRRQGLNLNVVILAHKEKIYPLPSKL